MKLLLTSLLLLATTASFAESYYQYEGVSPGVGTPCRVEIRLVNDNTLREFTIYGAYKESSLLEKTEYHEGGRLSHRFDGLRHSNYPDGLVQTPTLSKNNILFRVKDDIGRLEINMKGKSIDNITSVTYKDINVFLIGNKELSSCDNLTKTSSSRD